jgi:hypothetical protein
MRSITVHNIDEQVAQRIESLAQKSGSSLNKTIQLLLRQALGFSAKKESAHSFDEFCGVWSKKDVEEFNAATAACERIDHEVWK